MQEIGAFHHDFFQSKPSAVSLPFSTVAVHRVAIYTKLNNMLLWYMDIVIVMGLYETY